jgi:hypothetical protein
MNPESWDWSLRSSTTSMSTRATTPRASLDPDGNNVEALYRDVGNIGHVAGPTLR